MARRGSFPTDGAIAIDSNRPNFASFIFQQVQIARDACGCYFGNVFPDNSLYLVRRPAICIRLYRYIRDFGVFFRFVHLYRRSTIFIHYSQPIDPPLRDAILSANVEIEKFRAIQIYSMFACHHISFHHKTLAHEKISDIRVYEFFFVCASL